MVLTQVFMFLVGLFLLIRGLWYPLGEQLWDYMAVTGAIYFTGACAALVGGPPGIARGAKQARRDTDG